MRKRLASFPDVTIIGPAGATGLPLELDAETGEVFAIDAANRSLREAFAKNSAGVIAGREQVLKQAGVDVINIFTDTPYTKELIRFFRKREKKRKR